MNRDLVLFLASLDDDEFEEFIKQASIRTFAKGLGTFFREISPTRTFSRARRAAREVEEARRVEQAVEAAKLIRAGMPREQAVAVAKLRTARPGVATRAALGEIIGAPRKAVKAAKRKKRFAELAEKERKVKRRLAFEAAGVAPPSPFETAISGLMLGAGRAARGTARGIERAARGTAKGVRRAEREVTEKTKRVVEKVKGMREEARAGKEEVKRRSWVPYIGSAAAGIPLGLGYGYLVGRATKQSSDDDLEYLIDELMKEAGLLEATKVLGRFLKGTRQHARAVREAWRAGGWQEAKEMLGVKKEMLSRRLHEAWRKGRPAKEEATSWARKYLLPGAAGAALAAPIGFGLGRRKEGSDDGIVKLAIAMHLADISGKDIPLEKVPPEIFGRLLAQYISKGGE